MRDTAAEPPIDIAGAGGSDTGVQAERLAATFVFDARTGSLVATETCRHLFGLDAAAQTTLEALLRCIHPDDRSGFAETAARLLGGSGESAERAVRVTGANDERLLSVEMRLLRDEAGRTIGRGLVAYDHDDAARIIGRRTGEIVEILGYRGRDAMVHRDDLALAGEG